MAVAIPFVGAAVGWLAGGTAMWAQVGWMVGSMIYSAAQPTPTISAGNPSTAPSVGSDIRGQNLPVIFGTCRCSGYLIWQANFKANKSTRKVGSGKKKSKQEYYEYTWDFIYHLGQATRPYRIIGMWEGSERIQDDSMAPIVFADGEVFRPAVHVEQQENLYNSMGAGFWNFAIGAIRAPRLQSAQAAKSAAWAEAYWYGAHDSDSAENGWTYFQIQENAPLVRWPSSLWIGFKQLDLGEQPRVPQYNFEVTPDIAPVQNTYYNSTVITQRDPTGNDLPLGVTIAGKYSVSFDFVGSASRALRAHDTTTGAMSDELSVSDVRAMFPGFTDNQLEDGDWQGALPIPGTNDYMLVYSGLYDPGPSNEAHTTFLFVHLNEFTGTFEPIGSSSKHYNLPIRFLNSKLYCAGLDKDQRYVVMVCQVANLQHVTIISVPYPRTNQSNAWVQTVVDGTMGDNMFTNGAVGDNLASNSGLAGFMVPMNDGTVRWYFYVSNLHIIQNVNSGINNPVVAAGGALYPQGFLGYIEIDPATATIVAGPSYAHGDFDQMGPPFDNALLNEDGTTATGVVGYKERFFIGPSNMAEPQSSWIVVFERDLSDAANAPPGMAHSVRIFELETENGQFTFVGTEEFQLLEDVPLTYRLDPVDRYSWSRGDMMVAYAPITGELIRIGRTWDSNDNYLFYARVGRARVGIVDMTPPEIIYEIFRDPVIGFNKPADQVDTDSYNSAVQYCIENGIMVSGVFAASMPRIQIFENLVNVYGGWVAWNGFKLKFGKPTEVFSSVFTIDNSCFVQQNPDDPKPPITGKRQALQDTTNKVTIKYFDRQLSYRQNEVTLGDEVDQDLNGVRHKQLVTGLVMHQDTAYRLAERTLWGNMYARNIYGDVLVGWKCVHLEPGDPITLVDSTSDTNVNARIVRREEVGRGQIKLTCVEELDYLGKSVALVERPKPRVRGIPTTTEQPLDFDAYEMPSEFQKEGPRYYVGYAAGGPTAAAGLYTSPSTTDFTLLFQTLPFPDGGRILSTFPANENIVEDVLLVVNARSGSNPNSISVWFEGDIPDYSSFERASGLSMLRVGSEMMAYEGATLVGSNVYQLDRVFRGVGGTQISAHSPGDVWWAHIPGDGGGLFSVPYASDQIGTQFFYKVVPVGFDGVEYDPTSIAYKSYIIGGDHFTPRALDVSDVRVLVGSATFTAPASLAAQYGYLAGDGRMMISPYYKRFVGSSEERNFAFQWPETSQTTGFGAQGYGTVPYGNFAKDLDPVTWDVAVVGSGGTIVRSVNVTTPYFSYDAITNSGDNSGWRGNVAISIRPRNVYGPAPHTAVVSLEIQA